VNAEYDIGESVDIMDSQQNIRLKKLLKKTMTFLLVGVIYFCFVKFANIGIPCVFSLITGKLCAGCGITRMIMSLARWDIKAAMEYNAFALFLLLPAVAWGIYRGVIYVKRGKTSYGKIESICLIIVFISALVFSVLRNYTCEISRDVASVIIGSRAYFL